MSQPQPLIKDPLERREHRVISRALRESGIIGDAARFVAASEGPVTVFAHPVARGAVPPHRWTPRTPSDVCRMAEEGFVSLAHITATAHTLQRSMARRASATASYIPPVTSDGLPLPPVQPLPGSDAGDEALLQGPDCRVCDDSLLAEYLDHINGVTRGDKVAAAAAAHPDSATRSHADPFAAGDEPIIQEMTSAPVAPSQTVPHRATEVFAVDARMLLFTDAVVLVVPVPGWVDDEAFAVGIEQWRRRHGGDPTGAARARRRQQRALYDDESVRAGDGDDPSLHGTDLGTHEAFDAVASSGPPPATLPAATLEACRIASRSLRAQHDESWFLRKQNPFSDVARYTWEPRRFLVRVLPIAHMRNARVLARDWWSTSLRGDLADSTLARTMRALPLQLAVPSLRESVTALHGVSFLRGGAKGAVFSSDLALDADGDDGPSSRVGQLDAANAVHDEYIRGGEVAVQWSGAHDYTRLVLFAVKAVWGLHPPVIKSTIDADAAHFAQRREQRSRELQRDLERQQQRAAMGLNALTGPDTARAASTATSAAGVYEDDEGTGAEAELFSVSDQIVRLWRHADEHRALVALFGLRTILNPATHVPPIQALAGGAARDVDGYETPYAFICGYHYEVEAHTVFPPAKLAPLPAKLPNGRAPSPQMVRRHQEEQRKRQAPPVLRTLDHVALVPTDNLLCVCQRELTSENRGSDAKYRANVLATLSQRAGSRMVLDYGSILHISIAEASTSGRSNSAASERKDASVAVYRVQLAYATKPVVTASGAGGEFDAFEPEATVELHRFYVCGGTAFEELRSLQERWLKFLATVVGLDANAEETKAAFAAFHALCATQLGDAPGSGTPASNIALPLRTCFLTRPALRRGLEQLLPSDVAASLVFAAMLPDAEIGSNGAMGRYGRPFTRASTPAPPPPPPLVPNSRPPPQQQHLPVPPTSRFVILLDFLRTVKLWMIGSPTERTDYTINAILSMTPPPQRGTLSPPQLLAFVRQVSSSDDVATSMWKSLPSHRNGIVPTSELLDAARTPQTPVQQRLRSLGVLVDAACARWSTAIIVGHPLWRACLRVFLATSIVCGHPGNRTAERDVSPTGSQRGSPPRHGNNGTVMVKPQWKQQLPWLKDVDAIPQRTHVFLERKYLHQRVFSLTTGGLIDEVWSPNLAVTKREGDFVIECCPDVFSGLRESAGVSLDQMAESLGIGRMTAALMGGSFRGLRQPAFPTTNAGLAAHIGAAIAQQRQGAVASPKKLSTVYATADGRLTVQFMEANSMHKLLTLLPKYHEMVHEQGKHSVLPRYLALYCASLPSPLAESPERSGRRSPPGSNGLEKLVALTFFVVTLSPMAVHGALTPHGITVVSGDGARPQESAAQWSLKPAMVSAFGQEGHLRFDVPADDLAPLKAALRRDVHFLSDKCGIMHYSVAMVFTQQDGPGGSRRPQSEVSAVADARRWMATRHLPRMSNPAARRRAAAMGDAPRPYSRIAYNMDGAHPSDSALLDGAGGGPRGGDDDDELGTMDDVLSGVRGPRGASPWIPRAASPPRAKKRIARHKAIPPTWTCAVCGTVNTRKRTATMIKPCHLCFGVNERVGSAGTIPVTVDPDEYQRMVAAAHKRLHGRSPSPGSPESTDGTALLGDQGSPHLSVRQLAFANDPSYVTAEEEEIHGFYASGDEDVGVVSPQRRRAGIARRPLPGRPGGRELPVDNFLRLAGAQDRRRPMLSRVAEYEQPGSATVPCTVAGRDDVRGVLTVYVVDALGDTNTAFAADEDATARYGRSLLSNVMESLGDDFL